MNYSVFAYSLQNFCHRRTYGLHQQSSKRVMCFNSSLWLVLQNAITPILKVIKVYAKKAVGGLPIFAHVCCASAKLGVPLLTPCSKMYGIYVCEVRIANGPVRKQWTVARVK